MTSIICLLVRSALLGATMLAAPAFAEDLPGSTDHPLVGRYDGASIVYYRQVDFDETALLSKPLDYGALLAAGDVQAHSGEAWLQLEGKLTEIRYAIPDGRSSLEVYRNHEKALEEAGFEAVFECTDQKCFTGTLTDPYLMGEQIDTANVISTAYFDKARYLLATNGATYVALLVGEDKDQVSAFVRVVETGEMEEDQIVVPSASEMSADIARSGKIDLYGIYFDSASAEIKPQSQPTLEQIVELLSGNPQLRLEIVGHTDAVGGADYNMDLSMRRAASVVTALIDDYGIDPDRLSSSGAGLEMPVDSNETGEGRARNRRVELRAQ